MTGLRTVRVPGDKSLTHRALILSALATGTSRLANLQTGEDARSTAAALAALGCAVPELPRDGSAVVLEGVGLKGLRAPDSAIDCGNSGTSARLLLGVLAGYPFRAVLTGDASLRSRPMRRVTRPLELMGARFEELEAVDRLPIAETGGALRALEYTSPHASAQIKSALLFAGLTGGAEVRVREPLPSRDHTERLLAAMGVGIAIADEPGGACTITLEPADALDPLELRVPGDFSAASFFLAFGLLSGVAVRIQDVGLNPGRTGLLAVVRRMGARIGIENERIESGEPVGDVIAEPSRLTGTIIGASEIPSLVDEVPVLAVLGAVAEGETRFEGAGELRLKESDRIATVARNLAAIGAEAEELPDGLVVRGPAQALSGHIRTFGDHRIAMAFGLLAALPNHRITLDDPASAAVSFPGFWEELRACAAAAAA